MAQYPGHAAIVEAIYAAATEPDHWTVALDKLRHCYASDSAAILSQHITSGTGTRIDVGYQGKPRYFEDFARINPIFDRMLHQPVGVPITPRDLMDDALLRQSPYFNEYCRPNGISVMCGVIISRADHHMEWITLNRGERGKPYDRTQLRGLDDLVPHIRRGLQMSRQTDQIRTARVAWEAALDTLPQAIVLLDRNGRVVFVNRAARLIDAARDGFIIGGDGTVAAPWSDQELEALIAQATRGDDTGVRIGGELALRRRESPRPLAARVMPLPQASSWPGDRHPAVLLLIADPAAVITSEPRQLMTLFGLTEREAALASLLAAGRDLNAAAAILGIGRETARTHLSRALDKTECTRQADLVRLVLAASIPVAV
jgi:DNA-binding CsgD family transcriptional regulator/PAS domain-containing protein